MQNVPKIVRQRLRAAARPDVRPEAHPDADLLTAFAERSLAEFERAAVLDHLAHCGDCRDVVALALPASEDVSGPIMGARRQSSRGWLTWPALRWGVVAAGVVAIASVATLRQQRPHATVALQKSARVEVAANEPKQQALDRFVGPAAGGKEKLQAPAAPAFTDTSAGSDSAVEANTKKIAPQAAAAPARVPTSQPSSGTNAFHGAISANALPHGPRLANPWQTQNNTQNQASAPAPPSAYSRPVAGADASVNAAVPSASETVEAAGAAPVSATEAKNEAQVAQNEAQNLDARQNMDLPPVDRAKAPVLSGSSGSAEMKSTAGTFGGSMAQAAPRKMLGYVFDPSGAVVPNARITITPSDAGGAATAVTNSQGAWLIAGLPTGSYKAQAEARGFKTTVLALNYDANQPSLYRFTLDIGNAAETVEVSAENALVQTRGAIIGGPITGRNFSEFIALAPQWTISATGGLQRSLDQGKTWLAVDVNANPAYFANSADATSLQISAETSRTKKSRDKDSKVQKQPAPALTFRAVTAAGLDVWAGGSGGALFHSQDAGNHWTRIVPWFAGTALTGDIISLDFPDPQHGKLSTSTSEVWTTADSGQTWQKQ